MIETKLLASPTGRTLLYLSGVQKESELIPACLPYVNKNSDKNGIDWTGPGPYICWEVTDVDTGTCWDESYYEETFITRTFHAIPLARFRERVVEFLTDINSLDGTEKRG